MLPIATILTSAVWLCIYTAHVLLFFISFEAVSGRSTFTTRFTCSLHIIPPPFATHHTSLDGYQADLVASAFVTDDLLRNHRTCSFPLCRFFFSASLSIRKLSDFNRRINSHNNYRHDSLAECSDTDFTRGSNCQTIDRDWNYG